MRGKRLAIFQLNTFAPRICIFVVHDAMHFDDVRLRHTALGMQHRVREVAIVRHEQDTARREVQSTDGINPCAGVLNVFGDRWSTFWVTHGRNDVPWFVQNDIHRLLRDEPRPVHLDAVVARIGFDAELGDNPAVDAHTSGRDEFFCCAS